MNYLKKLTFITLFLAIGIVSSMAQASLTFNQTFSTLNATTLELQLNSENIQVKPTKGSRIIVEAAVTLSSPNYNLLEFMHKSGRYELKQQLDTNRKVLILSLKRINSAMVIKGEEIQETINYTIYLPNTIKYTAEKVEG
jgi:hypothetical protein